MSARVWNRIALTAALLVWGAASQAQTTGAAGGQTLPQVRPAPVTGRVAADPAAVALRPAAQQPATSTARQVPPPANLNEPLLAPESEQVKARPTSSEAPHTRKPVATETSPTPSRQHVDHTRGVKKTSETQPRPHERKVKGKPHHAAQKASSVAPQGEHHQGDKGDKRSKRGAALKGHRADRATSVSARQGRTSARHAMKTHKASSPSGTKNASRLAAHKPAAAKQAHASSKVHHAHAAAAKASAPVAKKPVRHKHPSA